MTHRPVRAPYPRTSFCRSWSPCARRPRRLIAASPVDDRRRDRDGRPAVSCWPRPDPLAIGDVADDHPDGRRRAAGGVVGGGVATGSTGSVLRSRSPPGPCSVRRLWRGPVAVSSCWGVRRASSASSTTRRSTGRSPPRRRDSTAGGLAAVHPERSLISVRRSARCSCGVRSEADAARGRGGVVPGHRVPHQAARASTVTRPERRSALITITRLDWRVAWRSWRRRRSSTAWSSVDGLDGDGEHGDGVGRGVVRRDLDAGDYWYGLSMAGEGAGAALATLAFGGHRFRMSLPAILLIASPCMPWPAPSGCGGVPWLMALGWLLWGLTMGPEIVRSDPSPCSGSNRRVRPGVRPDGVAATLGMAAGYGRPGRSSTLGPRATTTSRRWSSSRPARSGWGPGPVTKACRRTPSSRMVSARWSSRRCRPSNPRSGSDESACCRRGQPVKVVVVSRRWCAR